MFQYQIDDMRQTMQKLLKRRVPPERVGIKLAHAEFLGVKYSSAPPMNESHASGLLAGQGVLYGSIVMVSLLELFQSLDQAVGVDVQAKQQKAKAATSDLGAGESEAQDSDTHERAPSG